MLSGNIDNQFVGVSAAKNQRNNTGIVNQTPKSQQAMLMLRTEGPAGGGQQQDFQHAALQEKYAALLNKNLEDTSNLAKTLRNTKAHIYDKLRNSYQNANQLMQRATEDPQGYKSHHQHSMPYPPNSRVSNQNRFGMFNATDKVVRLDYAKLEQTSGGVGGGNSNTN